MKNQITLFRLYRKAGIDGAYFAAVTRADGVETTYEISAPDDGSGEVLVANCDSDRIDALIRDAIAAVETFE